MRKRKGSVRQPGDGGGAGQAKATPDNQCRCSRSLCSEGGGAGRRTGSRGPVRNSLAIGLAEMIQKQVLLRVEHGFYNVMGYVEGLRG